MKLPSHSDAAGSGQGITSSSEHTMAEEGLMPPPSPPKFRTRDKKRRQAEYSARHRAKRADVPEMRVVDRVLVEALGLHLQTLPPEVAATIAPAIAALAIAGLEFSGYARKASARSVGKRLLYLTSVKPRGVVRAARHRASIAAEKSRREFSTP